MAFDKSDESKPIGTFKQPVDGKLIDCSGGVMVSLEKLLYFTQSTAVALLLLQSQQLRCLMDFNPFFFSPSQLIRDVFLFLFRLFVFVLTERRHAHK